MSHEGKESSPTNKKILLKKKPPSFAWARLNKRRRHPGRARRERAMRKKRREAVGAEGVSIRPYERRVKGQSDGVGDLKFRERVFLPARKGGA